jgi:uncharacterized protein
MREIDMDLQEGILVRVFITDKDKHEGMLLADWIVHKAREVGISGATVLRGIEGFGTHSKIHNTRILDLSDNLPLVVELVDTKENVDKLLPLLDGAISEGLATTQAVTIRKYRSENTKR